jgi:hypothetical protein
LEAFSRIRVLLSVFGSVGQNKLEQDASSLKYKMECMETGIQK